MQLTLTRRLITLCAYSGCWEGEVGFDRSASGVRFLQARMRRVGAGDGSGTSLLSVMFSPASATAQMNWHGFQSVLECGSEAGTGERR